MTESEPQEVPGVDAGQLIMDIMRACSPAELRAFAHVMGRGVEMYRPIPEALTLANLLNVLKIAADYLLSEHPDLLGLRDVIDLSILGDAPEPEEKPDV